MLFSRKNSLYFESFWFQVINDHMHELLGSLLETYPDPQNFFLKTSTARYSIALEGSLWLDPNYR